MSLHSGFPVSVVDRARAAPPFHVAVAPAGAAYVFNASGQTIDLAGLPCLFDADGPCANAVRDAQRTKTRGETTGTLSVMWGCAGFEARLDAAVRGYRGLLHDVGAATAEVFPPRAGAATPPLRGWRGGSSRTRPRGPASRSGCGRRTGVRPGHGAGWSRDHMACVQWIVRPARRPGAGAID